MFLDESYCTKLIDSLIAPCQYPFWGPLADPYVLLLPIMWGPKVSASTCAMPQTLLE